MVSRELEGEFCASLILSVEKSRDGEERFFLKETSDLLKEFAAKGVSVGLKRKSRITQKLGDSGKGDEPLESASEFFLEGNEVCECEVRLSFGAIRVCSGEDSAQDSIGGAVGRE